MPPEQPSSQSVTFTDDCRFYLAKSSGPMSIELVDGCHGGPEGVAKAAKLIRGIFGDRDEDAGWFMVEITPVPSQDVPVNEDAVQACRYLMDEGFGGV